MPVVVFWVLTLFIEKHNLPIKKMKWNNIESEADLAAIVSKSEQGPVLIFKHSTRCPISQTALDRLGRSWKPEAPAQPSPYYLDLLEHRNLSGAIAERFQVTHQSPQALLIWKGKCIYNASHLDISYLEITGQTRELLSGLN
jgi:bacillithiol system protein YtxJ